VRVRPTRHLWGPLAALLAAALLAPGAGAHQAANPSLDVTFFANGQITMTLGDGTPVGTANGTPTVIPAGYYQVLLTGPGGCVQVPSIDIEGPGISKVNNLDDGEVQSTGFNAYLAPSSTYTWRNTGAPGTVNTFTTSATVVGSTPTVGSNGATVTAGGTSGNSTSTNIVGSAAKSSAMQRPTIVGTVNSAGKLSIALDGKSVTKLLPGMYTVAVTDRSSIDGFMVGKAGQRAVTVTGGAFTGHRTATVDLTAGRWLFIRAAGKPSYSITVS
jgi:hypothetical protein